MVLTRRTIDGRRLFPPSLRVLLQERMGSLTPDNVAHMDMELCWSGESRH